VWRGDASGIPWWSTFCHGISDALFEPAAAPRRYPAGGRRDVGGAISVRRGRNARAPRRRVLTSPPAGWWSHPAATRGTSSASGEGGIRRSYASRISGDETIKSADARLHATGTFQTAAIRSRARALGYFDSETRDRSESLEDLNFNPVGAGSNQYDGRSPEIMKGEPVDAGLSA